VLLVPIWGGKRPAVAARALEHSVHVVASGYDYASEVLDPLANVLARVPALNTPDAAVATINLAQRFREDWIGDWRDVVGKQRRTYKAVDWTAPTDDAPPPPNVPPTVSITSPASGASFAAPATIAIAADATDNDGSVTQVQFYSGATLIGTSTTSPFGMTWSNVPAGSYTLTAKATDNSGAVTASRSVATTVTATTPPPPGLPAPWQTQDIGKVGVTGNASVTAGVFTVRGSGADVWGPADAFRFVYQSLAGDGAIIARVASVQNVYAWTKAGVMIRQTTDAGSTQTSMFVTPGKGLSFQRRIAANGTSVSTTIAGAAPYWVRLVRAGQVITASVSPDGTSWTDVGQDTIAISGAVWIGLAVTSHDNTQLATATFDNVTVR